MTQATPHIDERLLMQFLLGETTTSETQQISEWLLISNENQKLLDQLEAIWAETGKLTPTPVAVDKDSAWKKMSFRIDEFEEQANLSEKKVRTLNQKIVRFTYAAAALLAIAFGLFQFAIKPNLPVDQLTMEATDIIYQGKLPDGSEIALNLNSKITYPEKFQRTERYVELKGEGFFEVAHNQKKPFTIQAGDAHIKVLGTSFNVKAYPSKDVEVSVTTGRVQLYKIDSLKGDTSSVFLQAGQKGVLPHAGTKPKRLDEPVSPDEIFWKNRTLVFQQTKLSQVIKMLEKHYPVSIKIENPMALECNYSATFSDAEIEIILEMISNTFNFKLRRDNNNYIFVGNGCLDD